MFGNKIFSTKRFSSLTENFLAFSSYGFSRSLKSNSSNESSENFVISPRFSIIKV